MTSTRTASMAPSIDLGWPARPAKVARAASTASTGSDLPCRTPRLAALAVDLDDFYALVPQVPRQAGPVGACPLHSNLCHFAKPLQPRKHCLVAGGVRWESLCSEQAANRIERSGDVHIKVSVHAAGNGACSFYDGHGHPFLPMWSRGGTAVPDRSDGRLSLLEQAGPITLPLGRDVPLSMSAGRPRPTGPRHDLVSA